MSVDSKFDRKMIELDTELIVMRRNVSENLPNGSSKVSKLSECKEGAFENEYSSDEEVAQSDWSEEDILKKKPVKRRRGLLLSKKANFNKKKRTPQTKKSSLNEKVYILPDKADFVVKLGLIPSIVLFEKMAQRDEERLKGRNSRQSRSRRAAKILNYTLVFYVNLCHTNTMISN